MAYYTLMPHIQINGADLYYEEYGEGTDTIVFSHGFLFSKDMFDDQINDLKEAYHIIAFDHRGQGKSQITDTGYDIDNYTTDAIELVETLATGPVHFAGLSTGGFVGLRIALRRPDLIKSLILINTSAQPASGFKKFKFKILRIVVKIFGFGIVINQIMKALFGKTYLHDGSKNDEREKWKQFLKNNNREGMYKAFEAAVEREDITEQLSKISQPCLIIGGSEDKGLSPEEADHMDKHLPNSELHILENVGHSSTIEKPDTVSALIREFVKG